MSLAMLTKPCESKGSTRCLSDVSGMQTYHGIPHCPWCTGDPAHSAEELRVTFDLSLCQITHLIWSEWNRLNLSYHVMNCQVGYPTDLSKLLRVVGVA